MKIGSDSLYAEMQKMAIGAGSTIQPPNLEITPNQSPKVENPAQAKFGQLLTDAINNVNELGVEAKEKTTRFEMGDQSISLADVMIAKGKSSIAFEATVQVRNKVLEAYEKIMNMPV
ncbi:flagellar hook-basal body complex protein FliE [Catenovulum sp. 2E275]|uniref:flagellar hook-basal body complex protein FliE n=1 Tax=Catenovulum sp. 2E275 TaxID=2980497 RepID=UPI0021D29DFB|nr:flagellar hook-basal body complex protein FliE [Catenovulum sp. 2E275]MCU4674719.1 flagellar hook-basal body complex protein FliE [Catenovulum sp. 2E275]